MIAHALATLGHHALDFFLPRFCLFCQTPLANDEDTICSTCRGRMPLINSPVCQVCGAPFQSPAGNDRLCQACQMHPPPFVQARAAAWYENPVHEAIHRLKYQRQMLYSRPLQSLLTAGAGAEMAAAADCIVPVPLHPRRLRQRGFNQALILARAFPPEKVAYDLLVRLRWTEPQVNLSGRQRQDNIRGAFAVRRPEDIEGRTFLLIDDVYTTGATVRECAKVLMQAGAARVAVLTVARVGYA